ncbi:MULTISPECIES: aspartate ammonia-lyase [Acidobacterium]|uniref:Aspartate ammonia-lyase n=1 Tax=Acidobacterium capsulatum (strain ATCC 51196 / DSM 11244 / BCRC 80197 / JCM 7670 / NBRC 15755 / NCIMB 13165 / 161) TaxID=240015 RepID=C1F6I6_ACIC5|nr:MULTISPECIES: aspartate ammonia-lyase [Acidobacterium]ACO32958.1 aspartate ammonia-lyase [Acidobacterium capsulatum ATCC 51196]HCT60875.1 aspartate ammonia-lyase [Acidobacterium sp.]
MTELRKEKDSLGFVEVPANAYYGAQTARAVENYPISGMRAHPQLIRAFGMVKQAAAEANQELGLVEAPRAEAIRKAAQEVMDGKWNAEFVVDVFQAGAGVSFHMNTNEVIANRANEILGGKLGEYAQVHPNDHVNYGQSTNDVFPTGMRVATLLALETLYPVLDKLAATFEAKAKEFHDVMKSGRTHMQDAVPIRLGQEFAAYGLAIEKGKKFLTLAADSLRELGLGGSAVGTGINTHPDYRAKAVAALSRISGQKLTPAADMRWAMQSNACMADVSAALRGIALEVIRISNDLRLISSGPNTGYAEIYLPSLQPGSSIMPGKINPVMPELAAMVSFQVVGNDTAVAMAVQAGQLELNVMMPTMAYSVLQSITILANMLRQFNDRCVAGITANAERCAQYAQSTVSLATALNPYIGYAKAAEIVKESVATGQSIISIARSKGLLSEQEISEILDPVRMTEPQYPLDAAKERDKKVKS